jgi:hypothetical protein
VWEVAVRWLPWRPRWKHPFSWWAKDSVALANPFGEWAWLDPVFYFLVVSGVVILVLGVLATVAAWIATLGSLALAVAGRLVLRRPFLVEATTSSGRWHGWWVVGWRRARAVRTEVRGALATGARPQDIRPAAAVAEA